MKVLGIFCILLFLTSFSSTAQIVDTLQFAREKAYQQEYIEANTLLDEYNQNKEDVYGLWLQAQVAYWMGNFERSKNLYRKATGISPNLAPLQLDYGTTLFGIGEIKDSRIILESYLQNDPYNPDALLMLAYMDYWKGETNKARETAQQVLESHPEHKMANELIREIDYATAFVLSIASKFVSDDQPIEATQHSLAAGKYFSGFFSPSLNLLYTDFGLPSSTVEFVWLKAGNKMKFGMNGPEIDFSVGVFRVHREGGNNDYTGSVAISQKLVKHLAAEVSTAWLPYQYTLASIEEPLMQQLSTVALSLDNPNSILGKLAYERQLFPDGNNIHTSYFYLLKSITNSRSFRFDLGYSFNYSHSDQNSFQPAEEGVPAQPPIGQITGVYAPYFSPQHQMVNSALASIRINPTDEVEVKVRTNYGFYAQAEQPFFFTSNNPGNRTTTEKGFYKEQYTPVEFFAGLSINLTKQLQLRADYQYSKLLFYELQNFGVAASYSFVK